MSRVGKKPVILPEAVEAKVSGNRLSIKGAKGSLEREFAREVGVEVKDNQILVKMKNSSKIAKALSGTTRAHIDNMVTGVSKGWSKTLELVGTGYRAEGGGRELNLSVGFNHPVKVEAPEGVTFKVEKSEIIIEGIDKELVGQVAAETRAIRPPEPYKGKGIKYKDEVVRRKPGKAAKAAGEGAAS